MALSLKLRTSNATGLFGRSVFPYIFVINTINQINNVITEIIRVLRFFGTINSPLGF